MENDKQDYFGEQVAYVLNSPFMNRLGSGKSFMRELATRKRKYNPPILVNHLVKEGKADFPNLSTNTARKDR